MKKTVSLPVENISEIPLKLEKGDILAEVLQVADDIHVANILLNYNEPIGYEHLNENEEKRLLKTYKKRIDPFPVNKSKIHSIDVNDETPVVSKARVLHHAYQKEIYQQINQLLEKEIVNKCYRCIEYLESVNTVVRYIPGNENIVSDYMSRNIREEERWQVIDACYLDIMYGKQANEDELFNISDEHSPDKIFDLP